MANISRYFKLNRRGESQAHVVYAVTFTIIAVVALVGLIMVNTEAADESGQSTTIANQAPIITDLTYGVSATSSVATLNLADLGGGVSAEGTFFTSVVTATVTDNNGCEDIDTAVGYGLKLYRQLTDGSTTESAAASCEATNGTNCYVADSGSLTLGSCQSSTAFNISWPVETYYFIDSTDDGGYTTSNWAARLAVTDDASALTTGVDTFEVSTLLALDVTSSTDFGSLAVGGSSTSAEIVVKHTGNANIEDFTVGYNQPMICTQNSFAGSNVKITLDAAQATSTGTAAAMGATGSESTMDASIAKASSMATSATDSLYAFISIPSNAGVRGSCSNTATYTAITNQ